jgi:hypothetical protein
VTYIAFICLLSGPHSIFTTQLSSWVHHFEENYTAYEIQAKNPNCLMKLSYSIDLLVQEQLKLLNNISIPLDHIHYRPITMGFAALQDDVIRRKILTHVPEDLIQVRTKKRKSTEQENGNLKKKDTNKRQYEQNNSMNINNQQANSNNTIASNNSNQTIQNKNRNQSWLLPSGKSFGETFVQSGLIKDTPQFNNTPFCLKFFTKGFCSRCANCRLFHKDP